MKDPQLILKPADLERIAAFLDGGLEGSEREEVAALIADDPAWREVFLETSELLRSEIDASSDGGLESVVLDTDRTPSDPPRLSEPLPRSLDDANREIGRPSASPTRRDETELARTATPFDPNERVFLRRSWLAAAAAIVIVGATAPFWLRAFDDDIASSERLAEAAFGLQPLPSDWTYHGWPVMRGGSDAVLSDVLDFRVGVLAVEIAAATEESQALALTANLRRQEDENGFGPRTFAPDEIDALMKSPTAPAARDALDEALRSWFSESGWFAAGRWAAASRIAALTGHDAYFRSSRYRSGLRDLNALEISGAAASRLEELKKTSLAAAGAQRPLNELIKVLGGG